MMQSCPRCGGTGRGTPGQTWQCRLCRGLDAVMLVLALLLLSSCATTTPRGFEVDTGGQRVALAELDRAAESMQSCTGRELAPVDIRIRDDWTVRNGQQVFRCVLSTEHEWCAGQGVRRAPRLLIYLTPDLSAACHEFGHALGWRDDHPDDSFAACVRQCRRR